MSKIDYYSKYKKYKKKYLLLQYGGISTDEAEKTINEYMENNEDFYNNFISVKDKDLFQIKNLGIKDFFIKLFKNNDIQNFIKNVSNADFQNTINKNKEVVKEMIKELITFNLTKMNKESVIKDCGTQCRIIVLSINTLIDREEKLIADKFIKIIIKIKEIFLYLETLNGVKPPQKK